MYYTTTYYDDGQSESYSTEMAQFETKGEAFAHMMEECSWEHTFMVRIYDPKGKRIAQEFGDFQ